MTDPDSRIMKTRSGYVQGYNGQALVCETQIIVAADLTQEENDCRQLHPMLEQAEENLDAVGVDDGALGADAGYWSEVNCARPEPDGPELFAATTKDWKQRKAAREQPPPRGRIPRSRRASQVPPEGAPPDAQGADGAEAADQAWARSLPPPAGASGGSSVPRTTCSSCGATSGPCGVRPGG